jgi:hypothetical protein
MFRCDNSNVLLCLIKHQDMKGDGRVELKIHVFLTSTLGKGKVETGLISQVLAHLKAK